jgi:DNA-directed RNA polymerase I, II, and III subunit RPABC2
MSSYFDNQYGGEDDDNKFAGDGSDSDNESSTTESEVDEIEEEEVEIDGGDIEEEEEEEEEEEDDDEQSGGALDEELEEGEIDEEVEEAEKKAKRTKKIPAKTVYKKPEFSENGDEEEDDGEMYLQKFDQSINENYVVDYHPESVLQNYDEILSMIKVVRDKDGIVIDDLHRTIPYLTKYEKARILGQRAKQINSGSTPFVKVPENVIDGYIIAELELKEKKIPFIIRRPLPNGGSEYWSIKDLEDISF